GPAPDSAPNAPPRAAGRARRTRDGDRAAAANAGGLSYPSLDCGGFSPDRARAGQACRVQRSSGGETRGSRARRKPDEPYGKPYGMSLTGSLTGRRSPEADQRQTPTSRPALRP